MIHSVRTSHSREGFTLLEIVVALGLSVGIIFVLTQFVSLISHVQGLLQQKLPIEADIGQTLDMVVTDIRSIQQSGTGAYPIESVSTSSFIFFSDVDQDGIVERVRYTFSTSSLQRGITRPSGNPVQYVTSTEILSTAAQNTVAASSGFSYFDSSYTGAGVPLAYPISIPLVRVVDVLIVANTSTSTTPHFETFDTVATIRNLKSN